MHRGFVLSVVAALGVTSLGARAGAQPSSESAPEASVDDPAGTDVAVDEAGGPPAETQPAAEFDPGLPPPDVSPIRADYVALMDDLVQARMRVAALGAQLFRTRITIALHDRTGEHTSRSPRRLHTRSPSRCRAWGEPNGRAWGGDRGLARRQVTGLRPMPGRCAGTPV